MYIQPKYLAVQHTYAHINTMHWFEVVCLTEIANLPTMLAYIASKIASYIGYQKFRVFIFHIIHKSMLFVVQKQVFKMHSLKKTNGNHITYCSCSSLKECVTSKKAHIIFADF